MQSRYEMSNVLNVSYAVCQIFDLLVFIGRSARIGSSTLHLVMLFCTCTLTSSWS